MTCHIEREMAKEADKKAKEEELQKVIDESGLDIDSIIARIRGEEHRSVAVLGLVGVLMDPSMISLSVGIVLALIGMAKWSRRETGVRRATGTTTSIMMRDETDDGSWGVVCDTHGQYVCGFETKAQARRHLTVPDQWCEICMGNICINCGASMECHPVREDYTDWEIEHVLLDDVCFEPKSFSAVALVGVLLDPSMISLAVAGVLCAVNLLQNRSYEKHDEKYLDVETVFEDMKDNRDRVNAELPVAFVTKCGAF